MGAPDQEDASAGEDPPKPVSQGHRPPALQRWCTGGATGSLMVALAPLSAHWLSVTFEALVPVTRHARGAPAHTSLQY